MGVIRPFTAPRAGRVYESEEEVFRTRSLVEIRDDEALSPRLRLAAGHALKEVGKQIRPRKKELFAMLVTGSFAQLLRHLRETSRHPMVAAELFSLCVHHMDWQTREVGLSRPQLASALGVSPGVVSRVCGELVKCGALSRSFLDPDGNRVRSVRYYVNAKIAAYGPDSVVLRRERAADPPLRFSVVSRSDLPTERRSRACVPALPVL